MRFLADMGVDLRVVEAQVAKHVRDEGLQRSPNGEIFAKAFERVAAAVLPKVGLESLRREAPERVALLTVERLMTRYAEASEAEKAMIERLVDRLTQRRISEK